MANDVEDFNAYRKKMNTRILAENNTVIKRIFNLDTNAFQACSLLAKVKSQTTCKLCPPPTRRSHRVLSIRFWIYTFIIYQIFSEMEY